MSRAGDYISAKVRKQIGKRAGFKCEYCLMPDDLDAGYYRHQVDHIISLKHRGTNDLSNLAYSCFYCNSCKGPDVGSIHDETGVFVGFTTQELMFGLSILNSVMLLSNQLLQQAG